MIFPSAEWAIGWFAFSEALVAQFLLAATQFFQLPCFSANDTRNSSSIAFVPNSTAFVIDSIHS